MFHLQFLLSIKVRVDVHKRPKVPRKTRVNIKERKNAEAATSAGMPPKGSKPAANPSRTPKPPNVIEIRLDIVTIGKNRIKRHEEISNAPAIKAEIRAYAVIYCKKQIIPYVIGAFISL